jgi:hypothetical protein
MALLYNRSGLTLLTHKKQWGVKIILPGLYRKVMKKEWELSVEMQRSVHANPYVTKERREEKKQR